MGGYYSIIWNATSESSGLYFIKLTCCTPICGYINENKIIVEGVNLVKRHTKPSQDNPQGGIMEKEAPIDRSNVALMHKNKVSRIGYKFLDNGKKVRFLKNTKEVVD